ncbi:MAG: hypothetical protein GQ574_10985 [Crocinitomix sp.]|nr:hypothetical protein [Crocinitomix sp.]
MQINRRQTSIKSKPFRKRRLILRIVLTIHGMIGIASILTMDISLPPEVEAILRD